MNPNIESLLSQPMQTLPADDFSKQVMAKIAKQEKAYQSLKKRILLVALVLSVMCLAVVLINFSSFSDFSWLTQLTDEFHHKPQSILLFLIGCLPILYLSLDELES